MKLDRMSWNEFLELCGERDRAILTGEEAMSFSDFLKFSYIIDCLELTLVNGELWSRFAGQFKQQFIEQQRKFDEIEIGEDSQEIREESEQCERCLLEFVNGISDDEIRRCFWREIAPRSSKTL